MSSICLTGIFCGLVGAMSFDIAGIPALWLYSTWSEHRRIFQDDFSGRDRLLVVAFFVARTFLLVLITVAIMNWMPDVSPEVKASVNPLLSWLVFAVVFILSLFAGTALVIARKLAFELLVQRYWNNLALFYHRYHRNGLDDVLF